MHFSHYVISRLAMIALFAAATSSIAAAPDVYQDEAEAREALAKYRANFAGLSDDEFRQAQLANARAMEAVTVEQVRSLLAREVTLAEVLNLFGLPFHASVREHEVTLNYQLPERRELALWIHGNFVVGARYHLVDIKGVAPMVHTMSVGTTPVATARPAKADPVSTKTLPDGTIVLTYPSASSMTFTPWLRLDDETFSSLSAFQKRIAQLPAGSVLVWQLQCVSFGGADLEPLRTTGEADAFREFCQQAKLRLIVRPGG